MQQIQQHFCQTSWQGGPENQYQDELKRPYHQNFYYAVLAQLELNSGISNADLARAAFITAQTMHGIITNLEKHRLITRKKDTQHGRILCIELTQEGKEVVQKAHTIIKSVESRMTKTMNTNDKNLLEQLLSTCLKNLT